MKTALVVAAALLIVPATASAQEADMFEVRCDLGDLAACNILGLMYEMGEGASRNVDGAIELYERACDAGEAIGCTSIGLLYENGTGVDEDVTAAHDGYRRACDLGERFACELLVAMDDEGPVLEARPFSKSGRVGDIESGNMLPNALVEIQRLGIQAVSDAQGHADLGQIPEGTYDLRTEVLGYEPTYGVLRVPGYAQFVVLLQPLEWDDPDRAGEVSGSVRDSLDVGLPDVEVTVLGQPRLRTLTNPDGNFLLTGVNPGLVELQLSLLGYATRTTKMVVQPGARARVVAAMSTDPIALDPIEVAVEERSAYLARVGFYDRARQGIGQHLTASDMDRLNPGRLGGRGLFEMLRYLNGVTIAPGGGLVANRAGAVPRDQCRLEVYVDGLLPGVGGIDPGLLGVEDVEAMEVYVGIQVPPEYSRVGNCGVILVWTRRP